jgi:hypothetical protein
VVADSGEIGTHVYIPDAHFLFPHFFSGSVNRRRRRKKTQLHSFLNKRRKEKEV